MESLPVVQVHFQHLARAFRKEPNFLAQIDHIRETRSAAIPHPGFPCVELDPSPGQQLFSQQIVRATGPVWWRGNVNVVQICEHFVFRSQSFAHGAQRIVEPFWLKFFVRTFLCSCGEGRFLFACFVQWFHQHDVTWAATGSGCCKTTSRRPCGAQSCEGHVLHRTGGHLPRSHRRSRSSRGATSQPLGNVDPQGNSQASNTVEILPSQHGLPTMCPT